ncbi:MAG: bifunctional diaminohydroxyphosphoribosylaminopyrimidine deaminase/5-amino-6-(5-phosphoribosylamino)uracil reductase RibD [Planctomycetota bacterium]
MQEALDLAVQGRGEVEPNPRVGALMLQDGEIVGRGFHAHYGGPHAEVVALQDARARGAKPDTAVVTLEPCSAQLGEGGKKTPPCVQALLDAGIQKVVVGAIDPDPRHRRRGLIQLEQHGVEIQDGVLAEQSLRINRPFQKAVTLDRPWTIAKWAMTLDGKTAAPTGEARWISGPESRRRTHELRARCDAVIVGFRTAQIDDPELTVRHVEGKQPVRIVLDPLGDIDDDSNLVRTASSMPTWILVGDEVDPLRTGHLQDFGVQVIQLPCAENARHLHLLKAWRELYRRGLRRVLVEGGGSLTADLFSWGCVDQVTAFLAPKIIGGRLAPTPVSGEGRPFMAEALPIEEWDWQRSGDDLQLSGFVY